MRQGHHSKRTWREVTELAEKEFEPDLASLIHDVASTLGAASALSIEISLYPALLSPHLL
jgi:hypothetical protein